MPDIFDFYNEEFHKFPHNHKEEQLIHHDNLIKGRYLNLQGVLFDLLVGDDNGSLPVVCSVNGEALKKFKAGDVVRRVATILGGSGGGRPDFASGAGRNKAQINDALAIAKEMLK